MVRNRRKINKIFRKRAPLAFVLFLLLLRLPPCIAHDLPSYEPSDYILPQEPALVDLADEIGTIPFEDHFLMNLWSSYYWTSFSIRYEYDPIRWGENDYWQLPSTTLGLLTGDCEDKAILLTSLLRTMGFPSDSVQMVWGWIDFITGGHVGYHAWLEIKIPRSATLELQKTSLQALDSLENKTLVLYLDEGPIYRNVTKADISTLKTLVWGERDGWIPIDPTFTILDVDGQTIIPIPLSLWLVLGYYVYNLVLVDAVPDRFFIDEYPSVDEIIGNISDVVSSIDELDDSIGNISDVVSSFEDLEDAIGNSSDVISTFDEAELGFIEENLHAVIEEVSEEPIPSPPLPPILSKLTITLAEIAPGDNVTIGLDIENIDSQSFTYIVTLQIGELTLLVDVELEPYESKTVSRTITQDMVGVFNVTVDGLTGNFMVKAPPKPAEFEFSNLRIFYPVVLPPEVERDQTVTVTVSIEAKNVGDLEGGRTVELKVDGEMIDSKGVTLEGRASTTVLFELTRGEGTHEVEVEGFTESFTVNPKPSFLDKIPGFPSESILIGLVTGIIVLWMLSRRKMTL